jgi:hypothetical protein
MHADTIFMAACKVWFMDLVFGRRSTLVSHGLAGGPAISSSVRSDSRECNEEVPSASQQPRSCLDEKRAFRRIETFALVYWYMQDLAGRIRL